MADVLRPVELARTITALMAPARITANAKLVGKLVNLQFRLSRSTHPFHPLR
jgi:hypothetical protein